MTRISVELVPRSREALLAEAELLAEHAPWADTVNLPDLVRFDLRSWDAAAAVASEVRGAAGVGYAVIPHLRARDVVTTGLPDLTALGLREVLVVSGDVVDASEPAEAFECIDVIRQVRQSFPEVTVWAGLDPWRGSMSSELDYLGRKLDAGASGVFTQPFFDLHLLRAWAGVLPGVEVWWGATTVTSEKSAEYWRRRNLVAFPDDFRADLDWHRDFAQRAIDVVADAGQNLYLMPVRASTADYLKGLRGPAD